MKDTNKLDKLETKARQEVKLDQDLILLTICASLLAVYGVKMSNDYILIGAMLVSPLFDPVISSVVFLVGQKSREFITSMKALLVAILISLFSSGIFWVVLRLFGLMDSVNYNRPAVSIDILGVSILMGIVGTLMWIWPKTSNTSAGVAIAISLVPPITNLTLFLILGDYSWALEYLFILMINIVGIYIGSLGVLKLYSKGKYASRL